jgi:GT2 family glycosyltransferase
VSTPLVDVVVVGWNGKDDTMRAIEAVLGQIGGGPGQVPDARITVVDNGSTDGTWESVLALGGRVRCVRLASNRGFTGGVAAGVEASDAELVVLLNNDAVPEPGWLEAMVASLEDAEDDVVAASGKIVSYDGALVDFIGGAMTFDGHAFQSGFRRPLGSVPEPARGDELLFACGGNMIVRRRPYVALGGFDDDYFAYLEDVDFGWRAWLSGWRVVYEPAGIVRHRSSATSNRLGNFERGVLFERNALQTVMKNYDDDMLREIAGPIFLTLLHRSHRYVVDRNRGTAALRRPAFEGEHAQPPARGRLLRFIDRLLGREQAPVIDDPLTVMQFRAIDWFLRNRDRVMEKRRVVQQRRKRSDEEIFRRFPPLEVPTYHGDDDLFSSPLFDSLRPRSIRFERKTLGELMER